MNKSLRRSIGESSMEQPEILRYAVGVLEELNIPYLIVGSFATSIWGEPRMTLDIDIVIDLREEQVEAFCLQFPPPEFYVSETAAREAVARRRQFNVLYPSTANKIDFMISRNDEWSRLQLERARTQPFDGDIKLQVCSPEDVIIAKMRYFKEGQSPKHLRDIAGVLDLQGKDIDRDYISHWANVLNLQEIWQQILVAEQNQSPGAGSIDSQ